MTVTIEDRIEVTDEFRSYFNDFIPFEERIKRTLWQRLVHGDKSKEKALRKSLMDEFGLSKRKANSIVKDAKGRYKALKALKREELAELNTRINKTKKRIKTVKNNLEFYDSVKAKRPLAKQERKDFKALKSKLYHLNNKLNKQQQKQHNLEKMIKSGNLSMCLGTKKLFKAQYYLEENGFKNHDEWLKAFRANRDKNAFYVGSKDEHGANQQFQAFYDEESDSFSFKIRKEYGFMKDKKDRYLYLEGLKFNHLRDYYIYTVKQAGEGLGDYPITYRIKRRGKKFYIQAVFELVGKAVREEGPRSRVGIDFNETHIDVAETDENGNLVNTMTFEITGDNAQQRLNCLHKVIKQIVDYARSVNKGISAENLNFKQTKAKLVPARSKKGKRYNKMLSSFFYKKYKDGLISRCAKEGVSLILVNPRNSSKIGKEKYAKQKALNPHVAAAYVIARRGGNFKDKLKKKTKKTK